MTRLKAQSGYIVYTDSGFFYEDEEKKEFRAKAWFLRGIFARFAACQLRQSL